MVQKKSPDYSGLPYIKPVFDLAQILFKFRNACFSFGFSKGK
jgi:hypothetical protein